MNKRNVIVIGSSREYGNTYDVATALAPMIEADLINLYGKDISYYDYENRNAGDDFLKVIKQLVDYDQIIMATPVYWYSMSAPLKTFFDRMSDLIRVEKDLGRSLQGKKIYAISCGSYDEIVEGFEVPFKKSAEYMHMIYGAYAHVWKEGEVLEDIVVSKLRDFSLLINA